MTFKPDPRLFPFRSRWLTLSDGARLHYVDEGDGPVLLLLHGNPSWSFLYRKIIAGLRGAFRCVAPDLPGFGLSAAGPGFGFTAREQAGAIIELFDRLDLRGAAVMMQDWGGPIGLWAAQRRLDKIDRLILGNTWGWPFDRWGPRLFSALMGGWPGRFGAVACNAIVRFFFAAGVVNRLPPEILRMYLGPFEDRSTRRPTHIFPDQLTSAGSFLREVELGLPILRKKPALILWGDQDFAFGEHERTRFRACFPNHRDITLQGAGHFIQEDAPDAICDAIASWIPVMSATARA
ncbi:MAG: alpha/beta fold hydrolase [Alphaproteobacteria bacterium]|nr:alpha/beta fold hydrolase [Alphaproteobacteria bacterium]